MDNLLKKQGGLKGNLTRFKSSYDTHHATYDLATTQSQLVRLESMWSTAEILNEHILEQCADDSEVDVQVDKHVEISTAYIELKVKLLNLQSSLTVTPTTTSSSSSGSSSSSSKVKLPPIHIPSFDGQYDQWTSFQDLFGSTIHSDKSLSDSQKLQYLKSFVAGEPEKLLRSLTITNANYTQAWTLLKDRYSNTREIVNSLLRRLFSQRAMTRESAADLQQILDTTNECLTSLKNLSQPTDQWDQIIIYFIVEKLDSETRKHWAMKLTGTSLPTYQDLKLFLEQHVRGLLASGHVKAVTWKPPSSNDKRSTSTHYTSSETKCVLCRGEHLVFQCDKFTSMSVQQRIDTIKKNRLCFNCTRSGHRVLDCSSKSRCRQRNCGKQHHTLLHNEKRTGEQPQSAAPPPQPQSSSQQQASGTHLAVGQMEEKYTMLGTVVTRVDDVHGTPCSVRLMIDSGCQSSLMTEACAMRLGLRRRYSSVNIKGINGAERSKGEMELRLKSNINDNFIDITAQILTRFASDQPRFECEPQQWKYLRGLQLADPVYYIPDRIDILLGADYLAEVMLQGIRRGERGQPMAQDTIFGWVISGQVPYRREISIHHTEYDDVKIVTRFWEVEEMPAERFLSPTEQQCEDHFVTTHKRDDKGRFVVELPFNEKLQKLGRSRQLAVKRLLSVERRLTSQPKTKQEYVDFMNEYESLGHMKQVPESECSEIPGKTYYLPHHFVLKPDSTTTQLRVVFDGSAKSTTGVSINDCLKVGPTIQDDIWNLLVRFRRHPIALKADVKKMFRQFLVSDEHVKFQRIVWRKYAEENIRDYELKTITYGTASAPFAATRCLQQVGIENREKNPAAADKIENDTYVDDMITSVSTTAQAVELYQQLNVSLEQAQLSLRKWASNSKEFLDSVPKDFQEISSSALFDREGSVKTLGVKWEAQNDVFTFAGFQPEIKTTTTKRMLLSELAKVFDPLGLITPFTIRAKLLLQELWKLQTGWDEQVSAYVVDEWKQYCKEFALITRVNIPRCLVSENSLSIELHGFGDASEKGYAACVYLRTQNEDGTFTVRLVTSKSKVAPIKQLTLARLELCSSVLCSQLLTAVKKALKLNCDMFAYTDSSITMNWIRGLPVKWKTFVGNRVAKIQRLVPASNWQWIPGVENPADLASRGVAATQLISSTFWWNGPQWLCNAKIPEFEVPQVLEADEQETRKPKVTVYCVQVDSIFLDKYSNIYTVFRMCALCRRFVLNCRNKVRTVNQHLKLQGKLLPDDLYQARMCLVKAVQQQAFHKEIESLTKRNCVPNKSRLLALAPFVDSEGVLRVGGRLKSAEIPMQQQHPAILPNNHKLTEMFIWHFHFRLMHAGYQLLWCNFQHEFWIVRARDTIRHVIRRCVKCRRLRGETMQQLMGSLPRPRVNLQRPFTNIGVDCAGPILLKPTKGRTNKTMKGYFVVFVCLATKAIHLEVVSEMTSEAFLAAFTRFISRRGLCSSVHSDCGTNFVGADKQLQELWQSQQHQNIVESHAVKDGIKWTWNSPGAPHHGGLWEAAVKSVKHHFYRVVEKTLLTYEEFETVLLQIEACVNSRPLCAMSSDPSDMTVLTPAHFLVGGPLTALPYPDYTTTKINRLSRWQLTVQLAQHFWNRWRNEYLSFLQQRFKWKTKRPNLNVNDLVLIKDENQAPLQWKMALVIAVHPGSDGLVRVATVKTSNNELKRPITKLCPILFSNDQNSE